MEPDGGPGSGTFCVYDLALRRISCFEAAGVVRQRSAPSAIIALDGATGLPLRLAALPGTGRFVITGIFAEPHRFLLAGDPAAGITPSLVMKHPRGSEPLNVYQHAWTAWPVADAAGQRIALGYCYTNRIEIYRRDGQLLHTWRPQGDRFDPRFTVRMLPQGPSMAQGGESRMAYIDMNAANGRIYALYSGLRRGRCGTWTGR